MEDPTQNTALQAPPAPDDPGEALRLAHEMALQHPGSGLAWALLGATCLQMKKPLEALPHLAKAVALCPDNENIQCSLAMALMYADRLQDAESRCREALRLKPDYAEAHFILGSALTKMGRLDEAVASYLDAIACKPGYVEAYNNLGNALREQGRLDLAVHNYQTALSFQADSAITHFNLGLALMDKGHIPEAIEHYQRAISSKPDYVEAYCNLGVALKKLGRLDEALRHYEMVLGIAPGTTNAIYNIGVLCELAGLTELAESWYRKALDADPGYVSAHINLATLLFKDGRLDEARAHRDLAYQRQCVFVTPAPGAARTVLMLLYVGDGNIHFEHLFPARDNNIVEWMIEYATPGQYGTLPGYDIVFNAIGDPDVSAAAAGSVERFLAVCKKPVLNHPSRVLHTARHLLPELLSGIGNLAIPPVWRVDTARAGWHDDRDFTFPLLVRPLGSQGGEGVVLADNRAALAAVRPKHSNHVYLTVYQDYRSADGYFRKYRVIFVDRKPYPYHLAISQRWMVHYMTAEMSEHRWKLDEELRFLEDPEGSLGAQCWATLEAIGARMDLDYAGIDFSILPDGRLLIFEANPTMLVHLESGDPNLLPKNPYVQRIFDAFSHHVARIAGV
jgi:tetratricopeptide (TPR) repeat protein